jgi:hypothetical protein
MTNDTPIACDLTGATDTVDERLAEYGRLFDTALVGRSRSGARVTMRLRADDGVEALVRDLSAREKACCPFFDFDVTTVDGEVVWQITVVDDPVAREILDEFYHLPETAGAGAEALEDRLRSRGMAIEHAPDRPVIEVRSAAP